MPTNKRLLSVSVIFLFVCLGISIFAGDLFAGLYLDSGHGGSNVGGQGVIRLVGYAAGNCAHCHEQHASIGGSEPVPNDSKASERLLFSDLKTSGYDDNDFCLYCHGGTIGFSNGEDDIAAQFSKAPNLQHDPGTNKSLNLVNGPVTCLKCHNPHVAQSSPPTNTHDEAVDGNLVTGPGSTVVSGALQGVSGVSASWVVPTAPDPGAENLSNPTYTDIDPITMEYELCLKCHSTEESASPNPLTPLGGQFNPNNYATHPIATTAWKNTWLVTNAGSGMKAPWNTAVDQSMYCSDCHGSDGSGSPAVGPHGSTNAYILKAVGPGVSYDNLCVSCHNTLAAGGTSWGGGATGHHNPQHQEPINPLGCVACHGGSFANGDRAANIHGTNYLAPTVDPDPGRTSNKFLMLVNNYVTASNYTGTDTVGNRQCTTVPGCHSNPGGTRTF
ncbi:MAG: cytochrome c3 family protein [Proteobacteria bacterium]|nr:cytochrome c3 family protein [Pseudomonadota bacterium]MBU1716880.1 cytochrome c3 family protein [Pseudomonadota bacterium]